MDVFALRLHPDQDLKKSLQAFVEDHAIQAGCILTTVGSLQQAVLRFANQTEPMCLKGKFEIVSLVGTLSIHGSHLHMAVADSSGQTIGGHVTEGCLIYTTAEIVLGTLPNLIFRRAPDPTTGYRELQILSPHQA